MWYTELNRQAAEYKLRRKFERQQQLEASKQAKQMRGRSKGAKNQAK